MAERKAGAAAAKKAIDDIAAVEKEDSGLPKKVTLKDKIAGQLVDVLSEKKTNLTSGSQMDDWLYIPETIPLKDGGTRRITKHVEIMGHVRILSSDGLYLLRWCHPGRFNRHQRQGFDFIKYEDMFEGTNFYKKSNEGHIQNGDLYLMKISIDGFGRMLKQRLELQRTYEKAHEGEVTRAAEQYNTKSFRTQPDGGIEFIN